MPEEPRAEVRRRFAEVAVPLPLPTALTYSLPDPPGLVPQIGCRARVRVGKRSLVGVIVGLVDEPPEVARMRAIDDILDPAPILPASLIELATFIADYYMAPLGETLRAMLPRQLRAWGDTKFRLTRGGAFAGTAHADERRVLDLLLEHGQLRLSELARAAPDIDLTAVVGALERRSLVSSDRQRAAGSRYSKGVELPEGHLQKQLDACGRSVKGRAVVDYLAALERTATIHEVTAAVECGPSVVRRLIAKGVLRSFTQLDRLPLDRHRLAWRPGEKFELNDDQKSAVAAMYEALATNEYSAFLLRGLTSSGKTEVYLRAVERVLEMGRSAILLVPEISLVPALAAEARQRFGDQLAILHSGLGASERSQEWERIRDGDARVVLGPRSAVLAPVENLGLIVVDEEQDSSYKQGSTPRYHGRDVALVRARAANALAVLVSATPSLETRRNVEIGKVGSLILHRRVAAGTLPQGILVDLRKEKVESRRPGEIHFSQRLREELEQALRRGEQAILLRNRRGYSPILLCRSCGENFRCDQCGLPRTFHKRDRRLVCHYCGSPRPVPTSCASCGESALEPVGTGTERVEETFKDLFPDVAVDVLDRDAGRRIGGVAAILERFSSGNTQVLIGTQMVSKGHHFPNVSLTGVLSADSYLGFPDFRAVEKTYALLTQLGGRAGRGQTPGKLVIQTYYPDHYAIRAALAHDDALFADEEMRFRRIFHYPPFTRMIQVIVRAKKRPEAERSMGELADRIYRHPLAAETRISGPSPAPLERLQGYWRFQLLARNASAASLKRLIGDSMPDGSSPHISIDVDPQDIL